MCHKYSDKEETIAILLDLIELARADGNSKAVQYLTKELNKYE